MNRTSSTHGRGHSRMNVGSSVHPRLTKRSDPAQKNKAFHPSGIGESLAGIFKGKTLTFPSDGHHMSL